MPRHVHFTPGKTRYPLYRRLGGPQGQSGWVRKISPPLGFDPWPIQLVASHHTDCAIPVHSSPLQEVLIIIPLSLQWVCESIVWSPWQFLAVVSMKISLPGYHTGSTSWSWSAWPSTWWHYDPLQCQEIHAQWQSITTHKASIFSNTAIKIVTTFNIMASSFSKTIYCPPECQIPWFSGSDASDFESVLMSIEYDHTNLM